MLKHFLLNPFIQIVFHYFCFLKKKVTKNGATLSWTKPDYDGGSRITAYILEVSKRGSNKFTECGRVKGSVYCHSVSGLHEGCEYEFRVKAKNAAGESEPRESFSSVITKDLVCKLNYLGFEKKSLMFYTRKNIYCKNFKHFF